MIDSLCLRPAAQRSARADGLLCEWQCSRLRRNGARKGVFKYLLHSNAYTVLQVCHILLSEQLLLHVTFHQ